MIFPNEKSSIWLATTSAIISFLSIGTNEVVAQEEVKVDQTDKKINIQKNIKEIVTISGIVVDSNDIPIPEIYIYFKGNYKPSKTDLYGKFSLEAYNCSRIEFYTENTDFDYFNDNFIVDGENLNVKIIGKTYSSCKKGIFSWRIKNYSKKNVLF